MIVGQPTQDLRRPVSMGLMDFEVFTNFLVISLETMMRAQFHASDIPEKWSDIISTK